MVSKKIVSEETFDVILQRLSHQLVENFSQDADHTVLIGIQSNGAKFLDVLINSLSKVQKNSKTPLFTHGYLDITFFRDDFRTNQDFLKANKTDIPFSLQGKRIVLVDDVLFTGRSIRSAMDGLNAYGRPKSVHLLVLVDRRFSRELPIQADFIGISVDSNRGESVDVQISQDMKGEIYLLK